MRERALPTSPCVIARGIRAIIGSGIGKNCKIIVEGMKISPIFVFYKR
jgi:hypothetical protein